MEPETAVLRAAIADLHARLDSMKDEKDAELRAMAVRLVDAEARADRLAAENAALREALTNEQRMNSFHDGPNTSPSKDTARGMARKRSNMKEGPPGRRGGVPGHEGRSSRRRSAGPAEVLRPGRCRCGSKRLVEVKKTVRTVTDIEHMPQAVTRTHVIVTCRCRRCGRKACAGETAPGGTSLGPRILAVIMDLWHRRVSLDMIREFLVMFGVRVAKATACNAWKALAGSMGREARAIRRRVARAGVVNVDETTYPVGRRRPRVWVRACGGGADIRVMPSRSRAASGQICPDRGRAFVSDMYAVYKTLGTRQVCWAHILRKADYIEGAAEGRLREMLYALFRDARAAPDGGTVPGMEARLSAIAAGYAGLGRKFGATLERAGGNLFTFVTRPGMEPTNNIAERALRPAVLHRKARMRIDGEEGAGLFGDAMTRLQTWIGSRDVTTQLPKHMRMG